MTLVGRQSLPNGRPKQESKKKPGASPGRQGGKPQTHRFGFRIKEATDDMFIPLLQVDVDNAEAERPDDVNAEQNFLKCVIAQAVTRACGASHVAIQRSIAYVAFPGENITRRYVLPQKSQDIVERWDRGETVQTEVGILLKAPAKDQTALAKRKAQREFLAKHPGYQHQRRRTNRKLRSSDPKNRVVRHGNLVRWS